MKKIITFFSLIFFCFNVQAEWTFVTSVEGDSIYIDLTTIEKNGSLIKIWEKIEFAKNNSGLGSGRQHIEYDCRNQKIRTLTFQTFSGNNLSGNVRHSETKSSDWRFVPAQTTNFAKLQFLCKFINN